MDDLTLIYNYFFRFFNQLFMMLNQVDLGYFRLGYFLLAVIVISMASSVLWKGAKG